MRPQQLTALAGDRGVFVISAVSVVGAVLVVSAVLAVLAVSTILFGEEATQ